MNTTVPTNTTAKTTSPRRSRFPGKESGSVSFNLTALGRQLLKEQAAAASVSNGDYVEMLIRERAGLPPLRLPATAKQTGPKGGAKSYFFGKNRGTTTAVCVTPMAHRLLDEQVAASRMSRGDYIEYLLREKSGVLEEHLKALPPTAQPAGQPIGQPVAQPIAQPNVAQPTQPYGQPVAQPNTFSAQPPAPAETTSFNPAPQPVNTDWNSNN